MTIEHEDIPAATLLRINKETFSPYPVNILLLYHKHGVPIDSFTYLLTHFLSRSDNNIQIMLGDFNINGFERNEYLENILADYTLIVKEPTHLMGSLLDHVYLKNNFKDNISVKCLVKIFFFSDHDAVKFQLTARV